MQHQHKGSMHHQISFVLHALWRYSCSIKKTPRPTHTHPEGVLSSRQLKQFTDTPLFTLLCHFSLLFNLVFLFFLSISLHLSGEHPSKALWKSKESPPPAPPTCLLTHAHADVGRQSYMGHTLNFNLGVTCFFLASPWLPFPYCLPPQSAFHRQAHHYPQAPPPPAPPLRPRL